VTLDHWRGRGGLLGWLVLRWGCLAAVALQPSPAAHAPQVTLDG